MWCRRAAARAAAAEEKASAAATSVKGMEREREAKVGQNHAAATEAEDEDAVLPGGG